MSSDDRFYVRDIREAKICMNAARSYFADRDWDWNDFLDHGRPVSDLVQQGDAYALRVAELVTDRS